ncbi:DUF86 domain-containing protein [Bacteroidota bacterium]
MSKRPYKLLLEDILESANKIKLYTSGLTFDEFKNDDKTIVAVVRNIEIIREASNRLPDEIQEKYSIIEWKRIIGFRNRIVHEYFGIDYEIVWQIIQEQIDKLIQEITEILKD